MWQHNHCGCWLVQQVNSDTNIDTIVFMPKCVFGVIMDYMIFQTELYNHKITYV